MRVSFGKIGALCVFALALSFLTLAGPPAQAQMMGRPPVGVRPPAPDTSWNWQQDNNWRRYQQRFFRGAHMQPRRGESQASFRARVIQQCNQQWAVCARTCNHTRNPIQRNVCANNCNNFLSECRAGW